jgi:hypothetical protein
MLKQSGERSSKLSLGARCGECLHYKKGPKVFDELCKDAGVEAIDKACPQFTPDTYRLVNLDDNFLRLLANAAKAAKPSQLRLLTYTLRNLAHIRDLGLRFGQVVYFTLGKDYISHFFKGYVIGVDKADNRVHIAASLKNAKNRTFVIKYAQDVLTVKQWKAKRSELREADRIISPAPSKKRSYALPDFLDDRGRVNYKKFPWLRKTDDPSYEPPTIDSVPPEWLDGRASASLKQLHKQMIEKVEKGKKKKKRSLVTRKKIKVRGRKTTRYTIHASA